MWVIGLVSLSSSLSMKIAVTSRSSAASFGNTPTHRERRRTSRCSRSSRLSVRTQRRWVGDGSNIAGISGTCSASQSARCGAAVRYPATDAVLRLRWNGHRCWRGPPSAVPLAPWKVNGTCWRNSTESDMQNPGWLTLPQANESYRWIPSPVTAQAGRSGWGGDSLMPPSRTSAETCIVVVNNSLVAVRDARRGGARARAPSMVGCAAYGPDLGECQVVGGRHRHGVGARGVVGRDAADAAILSLARTMCGAD